MCYFYGYTIDYVRSLDVDDVEILWQAITVIEAQSLLNDLWVNGFHDMKPDQKRSSHRKIYKQAFPSSFTGGPKELTKEQIESLLRG